MPKSLFKPLRILSIPGWLAVHYAIAALIMWFATPTPTAHQLSEWTDGLINQRVFALAFFVTFWLICFDKHITARHFLTYLSVWFFYVVMTIITAFNSVLSGHALPGIYLAILAYAGEMVFLLLSYSVYGSVVEISTFLADKEPLWRRLLSKTDLKHYEQHE